MTRRSRSNRLRIERLEERTLLAAHIAFVSSSVYGISDSTEYPPAPGVINSLRSSPDWQATSAAFNAGLLTDWNGIDVVYKAIMSDSKEDAIDRIDVSGPVFNVNGDLIASSGSYINSYGELITRDAVSWLSANGWIENAIRYDEFGVDTGNGTELVWTGTNLNGGHSISTCGDWSDFESGERFSEFGNVGLASARDVDWIYGAVDVCGEAENRIYGISPPLTVPEPSPFSITVPSGELGPIPVLSWESSAWAASYDLTVAADPDCTQIVQSYDGVALDLFRGSTDRTHQYLEPLSDGTYYACVSASNPTGTTEATNNGLAFTIDATDRREFAITAPTGRIDTDVPLVSWSSAADAVSYEVVISSEPDCSVVLQSATVQTTEYQATSLADGTYYICVTAVDAAGNVTQAINDGISFLISTPDTAVRTLPSCRRRSTASAARLSTRHRLA